MKKDSNFNLSKSVKRVYASVNFSKEQADSYKRLMIDAELVAKEAERTSQKQKVDLND